jgi:hypothetical protein
MQSSFWESHWLRLTFFVTVVAAFGLAACSGNNQRTVDAAIKLDGPPPVDPPPYRCDLADCSGDFARTCDRNPQTLDCATIGATCGAFTDSNSGQAFNWCTCGNLTEGDGQCLDGRYGVTCAGGLGGLTDCGVGYECVARPQGPFGIGCECNNVADGICPGLACSADPDCAQCTPNCNGRTCGDNGCGGECGQCDFGSTCTAAGRCEALCVPDCNGKQCGDDGCGGQCGTCSDGMCNANGQCTTQCVPSCTDRTCGSDGCGGSCGTCSDGFECNTAHQCGCPFFSSIDYTITLAPANGFPPAFTAVAINVKHINTDGSEAASNGAFLGFSTTTQQSFRYTVFGCKPKLRIKRDYAISGKSAHAEEVVTRTNIVIPAPVANGNGTYTAPPL